MPCCSMADHAMLLHRSNTTSLRPLAPRRGVVWEGEEGEGRGGEGKLGEREVEEEDNLCAYVRTMYVCMHDAHTPDKGIKL